MVADEDAHDAMAAGTAAEEAAAQSYCAVLRDPTLARQTADALATAQQTHGMYVRGRPLCTVLRPRFLGAARQTALYEAATVLAGVLERAGDVLLADDRLLDEIGAGDDEREVWAIDPGYPGFTLTSRLDSFLTDATPRFVEYNAESPAGIAFADLLGDIFAALPSTQAWPGRYRPPGAPHGRQHLLTTLLWAFREWGGQGTPVMAIIDWETVITRRDFELCAEYFHRQGIEAIIADPRRLRYANGRLELEGRPIDLIYRRVLLHELLARRDEVVPLLQAYRDGAVCMVNSPRSKLLHKKAVFALLSEGRLDLSLSPREEAVIAACVPWTRRLIAGETIYEGERTDLAGLLRRRPECFAIKPSDDYGGSGVVLGWDTSPERWAEAIETAMEHGDYVVQERVEVPGEEFPVWTGDRLASASLWLDSNPLLFRSTARSVLTRLSGTALLNVTAGTGSTAATFVVDGPD